MTPLNSETVLAIREHYAGMEFAWVDDDIACATTVAELCDSHEALRAQLCAMVREAERWRTAWAIMLR